MRKIRSVHRSLDDESTATLVHAFVASRIDYCSCSLLFRSPKTVTDKLQCVLNAAARVVTNTRKYDRGLHLHHTMRHDLHWLDMTDRIQFRIAVTVYRCLHGTAPEYLSELFVPASTRSFRHCLGSSDSNKLVSTTSLSIKISSCLQLNCLHMDGVLLLLLLHQAQLCGTASLNTSETQHYPLIGLGAVLKHTFFARY